MKPPESHGASRNSWSLPGLMEPPGAHGASQGTWGRRLELGVPLTGQKCFVFRCVLRCCSLYCFVSLGFALICGTLWCSALLLVATPMKGKFCSGAEQSPLPRCSVGFRFAMPSSALRCLAMLALFSLFCFVLRCVALVCSVLFCFAMCCSVLLCFALCCFAFFTNRNAKALF